MPASKPKKQFKKILLKGIIFLFLGILAGIRVSNFLLPKTTAASTTSTALLPEDLNGNYKITTIPSSDPAKPYLIIINEKDNYESGKFFYFGGSATVKPVNSNYKYYFQHTLNLTYQGFVYEVFLFIDSDIPTKGDLYFRRRDSVQLDNFVQLDHLPRQISFKIDRDTPFNLKNETFLTTKPPTSYLGTPYPVLYTIRGTITFIEPDASTLGYFSTNSQTLYLYRITSGARFLEREQPVCGPGVSSVRGGNSFPCNYTITDVPQGKYIMVVKGDCAYGESGEFDVNGSNGSITKNFDAYFQSGLDCILRKLIAIVKDVIEFLFNWGKRMIELTIYLPTSQLDLDFITKPYNFLLDLCNFLAVIGFLIIIFANLLRIELNQYTIKTMLPRLLLALVLMNFSLFITKIVVDLGNVFTREALLIPGQLSSDFRPTLEEIPISSTAGTLGGIGTTMAISGLISLSYLSGLIGILPSASWGIAIFVLIILLFPLLICLGIALLMIIRNMVIWTLAIVAPLAFIFMVLPFTQNYYRRWWSELACWTFKAPAVTLLIGLSEAIVKLMGPGTGPTLEIIERNVGDPSWLVPFFGFAFLVGAFVVAQTSCRSFQGAFNALLGRISSGFYATGWGKKFQIAGEMKKRRVQEELEKQVIDSKFLYRIPETQRVEKLAEIAKKDAVRYQIMHPGEDIKTTKQKAAAGNIQAQAYLLSIGEDFKGIDKVIDNNQGMAALASQTRPDLVYKDNQAIREAINKGQVDIARVQPQTIEALSARGFNFNDLDVNVIEARAPHLTPYLVQHFANHPTQLYNLSDVGKRTVHRMAFKTMSDEAFNEYINKVDRQFIYQALSNFDRDDLKNMDFERIQKAYNLLADNQKQEIASHLDQILEKTHSRSLSNNSPSNTLPPDTNQLPPDTNQSNFG